MNYDLTPEQLSIKDNFTKFCTKEIEPRSAMLDEASHEEVANLIWEYHSLGFDEFILSGYPHLEEAYWFAEGVFPLLRAKGVIAG